MSQEILTKIAQGAYSLKQLENLYVNALHTDNAQIARAAKEGMRKGNLRAYTKRFIKPIRDKIQLITQKIADQEGWRDWADNRVKNGVKPGSLMATGQAIAEYYISYRHPSWRRAAYLVVFQRDENDFVRYRVKPSDGAEIELASSVEAIGAFRRLIEQDPAGISA